MSWPPYAWHLATSFFEKIPLVRGAFLMFHISFNQPSFTFTKSPAGSTTLFQPAATTLGDNTTAVNRVVELIFNRDVLQLER